MRLKILKIIFVLFCLTNLPIEGQDSQYWSKQYGTYGALLGGTVIGASSDLSSTYYNPGSIAFSKDTSLILTTNSFQFIYLNFDDLDNSNFSLSSWYTNASQGIFALRLPVNFFEDDNLIASYISRQDFNFASNSWSIGSISDGFQESSLSNQISLDQSLNESWFGITWSKPFAEKIGFGVTMYVPYRSQRVAKQTIAQSYNDIDKTKNLIAMSDYDYYNVRLLWKTGISFQLGKVMLGLSLTTPSINLLGSGSASIQLSKANVESDSLLGDYPDLSSDFQDELSTYYKSPISIGIGTAYYWKNTVLYFSAEWFNKVNNFLVMEPESFVGQSTGDVYNYNINYTLKSVFNFGFGVKYIFDENFTYYGGITTDKTAYNPDVQNPFILSTWDIVQIRSGAEFKFYNLSITLGFGYGYSGTLFNEFNLFGIFKNEATDVIYHQIDVIFGLNYSL